MSFTYSDALVTDSDRVRFAVGDTVVSAGPKPANANFSDAEIAHMIAVEGNWQRATAYAFERLTALWTAHVTFNADGVSVSQSDIAKGYREEALMWRQLHGRGNGASVGSRSTTRADGYSDDLDNVTV